MKKFSNNNKTQPLTVSPKTKRRNYTAEASPSRDDYDNITKSEKLNSNADIEDKLLAGVESTKVRRNAVVIINSRGYTSDDWKWPGKEERSK